VLSPFSKTILGANNVNCQHKIFKPMPSRANGATKTKGQTSKVAGQPKPNEPKEPATSND